MEIDNVKANTQGVAYWLLSLRKEKSRMLTDKELEVVMMELETADKGPEIYRFHTKYGLPVVYYMFDLQKLENLVFEPIYFYTEDVERLGKSEEELFQIVLQNTVTIMQTKIIPYSRYLAEFENKCHDIVRLELIKKIIEAMEQTEEKNRLWCLTGIRERGASGIFCTEILKQFCEEHHFKQLLVGISNNDFAFLYRASSEELLYNMKILVSQVSHVIDEEDFIVQRKILIYDYETDTLEEFDEKEKMICQN